MNPQGVDGESSRAPVLTVEGLCFWYRSTQPPTVFEFDLSVQESECVGIVGASGSGKTTIVRLLAGLLSSEIERTPWLYPEAKLECSRFVTLPNSHGRSRFAYVPQNYHSSLLASATVLESILVGSARGRAPNKGLSDQIQQAVNDLEIEAVLDTPIGLLSGGQQQRVVICRALASEPSVLILDEPFANLDFLLRDRLIESLTAVKESCSIVLVSHDIRASSSVSDRVIAIDRDLDLPRYTTFQGGERSFQHICDHLAGSVEL